ncbi:hypothetical protein [Kitasatospora purpeofusca]|uniref:AAA+ ATPase domain-containing protein n=1 Tax=Kitasatospora purpeofusca TaxID=67352 RepID=A0ABZ1U274_9ACTN|nr:hypothetical protein [Kitasatospora purpeofusca]
MNGALAVLLTDLASLCGAQQEWTGLVSAEHGVREDRVGPENYVVPDVREATTSHPLTPSLLLITAPAAVGKSAAGRFLSNALKAPVIDLSLLQVGDGTLEGSLLRAMGAGTLARFLEDLTKGRATLIIDALDEAEVRSGQANFQAFIRGLAGAAADLDEKPAMIVLSRAESARSILEVFSGREIQYSHYEILAFDRNQAAQYLDDRIGSIYASSGRSPIHRAHATPFATARESVFSMLASTLSITTDKALWDNPEVRDFLGYAPVLDVVAEFLAVDNFSTLNKEFLTAKSDGAVAHWGLVARVINHLLVREQGKFVEQFCKTSAFLELDNENLRDSLYSPEEQCSRLLEYIEGLNMGLDVPAHLPQSVRDAYETAINVQLVNHPFLRSDSWFNVIFRDYVTARALTSPLTSPNASQAIRKKLLSAAWKHSPMLGYFSHSLSADTTGANATCHSEVIGALYESFKSMCETQDTLHTHIGRHGSRLFASFGVTREGVNGFLMPPLVFKSHSETLSITFPRELSHAEIFEVPEVIIGGDGGSFKFGPSVYLECRDLLVASHEVLAFCSDQDPAVILNVGLLTSDNVKVKAEAAKLFIITESLDYPWSQYHRNVDLGAAISNQREARALYLELRRIVIRFKDAKNGEAAIYQPFLDNIVIGENRRARTVLNYLQRKGCVTLRNGNYLLDFAEFSKLGISRSHLRDLQMTDAAFAVSLELIDFALGEDAQ